MHGLAPFPSCLHWNLTIAPTTCFFIFVSSKKIKIQNESPNMPRPQFFDSSLSQSISSVVGPVFLSVGISSCRCSYSSLWGTIVSSAFVLVFQPPSPNEGPKLGINFVIFCLNLLYSLSVVCHALSMESTCLRNSSVVLDVSWLDLLLSILFH